MKINKTFFCIDAHTCGNPVRVVAGGAPFLNGSTMAERREHFLAEFDWIRRGLMFEPRGHDMMSGSMLYPPSDPANDVGILFIETSGCLPMCGHGTIGTVTVMIEHQLVCPKTEGTLRIETPAGLVVAHYTTGGAKAKGTATKSVTTDRARVTSVRIVNIPSFLHSEGLEVNCPDLGPLRVDVAYGGNFYAIVDPQENFGGLQTITAADVIRWSAAMRTEMNERYHFVHPEDERISGLSHLLWTGETIDPNATARNAVFYGDKAVDRSPCGTGTSARMAQWAAKGKLSEGDEFVHESIIGSQFIGRIEKRCKLGEYDAIVPSIEGWARITGTSSITIDEDDPYAFGFQVI